ncbi:MAG: nitroreductase family protein [Lagierella massiliensis]|nr:nitroreductase family protein [Lagierella massiliensis]
MELKEFLESRKSCREYENRELSSQILLNVRHLLDKENKKSLEHNVEFKLYGKSIYDALKGVGGYSGVMIKSPNYITMNYKIKNKDSIVYGAYFLEEIVGELSKQGLGTCWITLFSIDDNLKKKTFGTEDEIDFILAFGYAASKSEFEIEEYSSRHGIEDFVYFNDFDTKATVEQLYSYGLDEIFYYIKNAPSAYNSQPWRFLIKGENIYLYIEDFQGDANYTDSGIVMYYYVKMAELSNIDAKWHLDNPLQIETDFKYIGRTNF